MDDNMVFGYGYCWWWNCRWRMNVPPSQAILMAMQMRWSNERGIAQWGMSRATLEATGRRHRATTCSVLPQRPPGQQAYKQQSTNTRAKMAILMTMVMHQYVTECITRWRKSRASLEATGRRHRVSIMPDNIVRTWLWHFFNVFIVKTLGKGHGLTQVWHIKRKRRA